MRRARLLLFLLAVSVPSLWSATPESAAHAVNAFGLDLHRQMPKEGNLCLSPYSIQSALAMTYLGASGMTADEMARVLHFPKNQQALGESFAALRQALLEAEEASVKRVAEAKKYGGPSEPLTLRVASRLFGQNTYEFRKPFLAEVKTAFGAPLQPMNFRKNPAAATHEINAWVAKQTQNKIRDLIGDPLSADTRLALVNALYFKAPWSSESAEADTMPKPFFVNGGRQAVDVPTMQSDLNMRYYNGRGFQAVTRSYAGHQLHFLLIIPDSIGGISGVEAKLTPEVLLACSKAEYREVILHLPKFKLTPPTIQLGDVLKKLGMTTAFDDPRGSADFDAMAPRKPEDYLYISKVFHKTFLELNEKGTEAAAATAVVMMPGAIAIAPERPKPIVLKADRPFLFAIQHAESGACLFLGRVTDPR
ncbi:serpin family protein [Prosthecobacter sp.]|uniref:serpin family protein n=1 Tax=Prosthecobacter sp. TaxID=1965333 RepID=UPI00378518DF